MVHLDGGRQSFGPLGFEFPLIPIFPKMPFFRLDTHLLPAGN